MNDLSRPFRIRAVLVTAVIGLAGVLPTPPSAHAVFPGDPSTIYFVRGDDLWAIQPDGSGETNLTNTPDFAEGSPAVSPDGERLAFHGYDPADTSDNGFPRLAVYELVDGQRQVLIDTPGTVRYPTWSRDGQRLAVTPGFDDGIEVFDPSTGALTQYSDSRNGLRPSWSPVSDEVVFEGFGGLEVIDASLEPGQERTLLEENGVTGMGSPDWAPDGSAVAFSCYVRGEAGGQLCLVDADGSDFRTITPAHEDYSALDPHFSPDGTEVVYVRVRFNEDFSNATEFWIVPADGGPERMLVDGEPSTSSFAVAWAAIPTDDGGPSGAPLFPGGFDADPATTERADFSDPVAYAVAVSQARFPGGGFAQEEDDEPVAAHVVLGRSDAFADSLAGTSLTGAGPLLFTETGALPDATRVEVERVLGGDGLVYLLGGEAAISAGVAEQLTGLGYEVRRLAGPSRFETAVAVAEEAVSVNGATDRILLARGNAPADNPTAAWADSVFAGVWTARDGYPLVLTPTDTMHPATQAFLDATRTEETILTVLGGTAAISGEATAGQGRLIRFAGETRAGTAAAIAVNGLGVPDGGGRRLMALNAFREDGWAFGLASAGLGADAGAPLVAVGSTVPPETVDYVGHCGDTPTDDLLLVGSLEVLSVSVASALDGLDGGDCTPRPR